MTQVILHRTLATADGTFGRLEMGGVILCLTCELPWRDNAKMKSCIPPGDYPTVKRTSPKYGHHWHIQDVPKRTLILIHAGNYPSDVRGCVAVGKNYMIGGKQTIGVSESKPTMDYLRKVLPDSFTLLVRGK